MTKIPLEPVDAVTVTTLVENGFSVLLEVQRQGRSSPTV
jgi:hypothetical protein